MVRRVPISVGNVVEEAAVKRSEGGGGGKGGGGGGAYLTLQERKEARNVLAAYSDFWTHLRFRKGWAEPPFSRQDVLPMLEEASALVAKIRTILNQRQGGFTLRMVDGSAREFFWVVPYPPVDHPDRFVTDLVHATFQDGKGYVEGLTREQTDSYLQHYTQGRLPPPLLLTTIKERGLALATVAADVSGKVQATAVAKEEQRREAETKGGKGGGREVATMDEGTEKQQQPPMDLEQRKEKEKEEEEKQHTPLVVEGGKGEEEGGGGRRGGGGGVGLGSVMEGAPLVRNSSVMGQADEILSGVIKGWGALSDEAGVLHQVVDAVKRVRLFQGWEALSDETGVLHQVVDAVKRGWVNGEPRRLLALRRLMLAMHNVVLQSEEIRGMIKEEEQREKKGIGAAAVATAEGEVSIPSLPPLSVTRISSSTMKDGRGEEASIPSLPPPPPTPFHSMISGSSGIGKEEEGKGKGGLYVEEVIDRFASSAMDVSPPSLSAAASEEGGRGERGEIEGLPVFTTAGTEGGGGADKEGEVLPPPFTGSSTAATTAEGEDQATGSEGNAYAAARPTTIASTPSTPAPTPASSADMEEALPSTTATARAAAAELRKAVTIDVGEKEKEETREMEVEKEAEEEEEEEKVEGRIEIQKVAEDVDALKAQISHLCEAVKGLESSTSTSSSSTPKPTTLTTNSERVLEELQGRCARFVKGLLDGLNVLDELHVNEKDRPLRKKQVMQIEQLIDDVEQTKERLRGLRADLKKKEEEERRARGEEEEPRDGEATEAAAEEEEEEEPIYELSKHQWIELQQSLAPHWRHMKLRPRFETSEHPHAYIIQAMIPGMKLADLSVTVGAQGQSITIKGYRGPSLGELKRLASQQMDHCGGLTMESILLAGAERYGSFVETLRLPRDADPEGLEATYEKGVLRVIVPRLRQPPRGIIRPPSPPFAYARGQEGHRASRGGRRGRVGGGGSVDSLRMMGRGRRGGGGFWGDQDLWW